MCYGSDRAVSVCDVNVRYNIVDWVLKCTWSVI